MQVGTFTLTREEADKVYYGDWCDDSETSAGGYEVSGGPIDSERNQGFRLLDVMVVNDPGFTQEYEGAGCVVATWEHIATNARVVTVYEFHHCSCNGAITSVDEDEPTRLFGFGQFQQMARLSLDPTLVGLGPVTPVLEKEVDDDDDYGYGSNYTQWSAIYDTFLRTFPDDNQ